MENLYLTPTEVTMIESWITKTHPDQIRSSFNIDLYVKIKKQRHDARQKQNQN
jgi:hypothetical protein